MERLENNILFLESIGERTTLIPYNECNEKDYIINLMIEKPHWTYLQETYHQKFNEIKIDGENVFEETKAEGDIFNESTRDRQSSNELDRI